MDFRNTLRIINSKGLNVSNRDFRYGLNKVRHRRPETFDHFLVKAILTKHIIDHKTPPFKNTDGVITEHETPDGRIIDVLQVKQNKELIAYEVENKNTTKQEVKGTDQIVLLIDDFPIEVKRSIKILKDYFKDLII